MVQLLVSMIGSGKSTYARLMAKEGYLIVGDDVIVTGIHGGINSLYKKDLKPLYKLIEYNIIHFGVSHGYNVIIDRPNFSLSTRRRYIEIAKSLDVEVEAVLFKIEDVKTHALRRFHSNSRGYSLEYWIEVCQHHLNHYVEPSCEEGFSKIYTWDYSSQTKSMVEEL